MNVFQYRDELRYILDPADVMDEDYPSETFRVLKNKEIREFGEYRTRRIVLEAWDRLSSEVNKYCLVVWLTLSNIISDAKNGSGERQIRFVANMHCLFSKKLCLLWDGKPFYGVLFSWQYSCSYPLRPR